MRLILIFFISAVKLLSTEILYPPQNSQFVIPGKQIILNDNGYDIEAVLLKNSNTNEIIQVKYLKNVAGRVLIQLENEMDSDTHYDLIVKQMGQDYNFNFKTVDIKRRLDFKHELRQNKKAISNFIKPQSQELAYGLPDIEVLYKDNPSNGYFFIAPYLYGAKEGEPIQASLMIVDNDGTPLFYEFIPQYLDRFHISAADFKRYSDTSFVYHKQWLNYHIELNHQMDSVRKLDVPIQNFDSDSHEIYPLPNGNRMMLSYYHIPNFDMTIYDDTMSVSTLLITSVVHEIDPDGNVIFQWNSLDHIDVPEMSDFDFDPNSDFIDYAHMNSIEMDTDSTLIFSFRNLEEITKINKNTGEIIWRMGGKSNQFEMISELEGESPYFATQHDARVFGDGLMSVYDNGGGYWRPEEWSRILIYQMDEENKIARLVRSYWDRNDTIFAETMGNAHYTDNNSWIAGMGSARPNILEFDDAGVLQLKMDFPTVNYRVYKYDWKPNVIEADSDILEIEYTGLNDQNNGQVSIRNNSNNAAQVNFVKIEDEGHFKLETQLPVNIPAGEERPFVISFNPLDEKEVESKATLYWKQEDRGFGTSVNLIGDNKVTSLEEQLEPRVYFNENNSILNILETDFNSIEIYNTLGFIVYRSELNNKSINLSNLKPGAYFVSIDNHFKYKFLKVK